MLRRLAIRILFLVSILALFYVTGCPESCSGQARDTSIVGAWQGELDVKGARLRIVFNVVNNGDGSFSCTMDSPDQGVNGIPAEISFRVRDSIRFAVESINSVFAARFSDGDTVMEGEWSQGGYDKPLKLSLRTSRIQTEQERKSELPPPYKSEDVSFQSKITGMRYAGVLTVPDSGGPFPAVILITGSGSHDRDETIAGHKPFMVIADFLTRRGFAVLRVDDRGVGGSSGNKMSVTIVEHAEDVIAEIDFLSEKEEIDSHKIGLIGHSEGTEVAPLVAGKHPDLMFMVLLGAVGLPGREVLLDQARLILKANGAPDSLIRMNTRLQERLFDLEAGKGDSLRIHTELRTALEDGATKLGLDKSFGKNGVDNFVDSQLMILLLPSMRFFISYDPKVALENVKCPVLALWGSKDLQVPAAVNLPAVENALRSGGNKDYSVKIFPGLNHLFQKAMTGSPNEYAGIGEAISTDVLKMMADWMIGEIRKK